MSPATANTVIEVTDAMVEAALEASDANEWERNVPFEECQKRDMRAAIEAALSVRSVLSVVSPTPSPE